MKKSKLTILMVCSLAWFGFANAGQREFCEGFEEGYKSIQGDLAMVPICPIAPVTPIGSTDYREELKAGMRAASR